MPHRERRAVTICDVQVLRTPPHRYHRDLIVLCLIEQWPDDRCQGDDR